MATLYASWDTWFGKLKAFKEQFGHCNASSYGEDAPLGSWVAAQRNRRKKGALADERVARLDGLGFVWDFQAQKTNETWTKWYRELENYAKEHGNPHVPRTHTNTKLASWVWIQRQRRKGTLKHKGIVDLMTPEQVNLLDKLGFRWDPRAESFAENWAKGFEQLKRFKEQHGHYEVGLVADADDDLLVWVKRQRSLKAGGKLDVGRQVQLNALGFSWTWEINDHRWNEMYERLKQYYAANGDSDVPAKWKEDPKLAHWLSAQRQRRKKGQMSDEDVRLLNSLGMTWKSREVGTWDERLVEVAAFKAKHGHCDIPVSYPENPKLGRFVNSLRTKKARGELSEARIQLLEHLGFKWGVRDSTSEAVWEARYKELLVFKAEQGHCNVPQVWSRNQKLARWIPNQRQLIKSGKLAPEKQQRLELAGVHWGQKAVRLAPDPNENWSARFALLAKFKKQHGHCDFPTKCDESPDLGNWVSTQRQLKKLGKLHPKRERMLDGIGFIWVKRRRKEVVHD